MAKLLIMDHTGHSTIEFDRLDKKAVARAERKFQDLASYGYTAAARDEAGGPPQIVRRFDPGKEETLFFPRLVGG